jgi:hypothetical protein
LKVSEWIKIRLIPWYTALGLTKRTVTLEVPGRKSGKSTRISLSRTDYGGYSYFVSLAGESGWVRNVRAAEGQATILSGGRKSVRLEEVSLEERAPVLLAYVQKRAFTHSGAQSARHFFGLGPNPTLEDMQALAERYIVFCIIYEV